MATMMFTRQQSARAIIVISISSISIIIVIKKIGRFDEGLSKPTEPLDVSRCPKGALRIFKGLQVKTFEQKVRKIRKQGGEEGLTKEEHNKGKKGLIRPFQEPYKALKGLIKPFKGTYKAL